MVAAEQPLRIERLTEEMPAAWEAMLRIYGEALPESERKSNDALRRMLANSAYLFRIAWIGDVAAGFSIVMHCAGCDASLLEYLAVAADQRGEGIGRRLFEMVVRDMESRWLLLEVEQNETEPSAGDDRGRRDRFYRARGCRRLAGLRYCMPPVRPETPPPMNLYVFRRDLPAEVAQASVRRWLECLYAEVYGRSANDPAIAAMLTGLSERIPLV